MGAMSHYPAIETAEAGAAVLAAAGMPRMPARVLMALVASPDEGYTAAELSDRLGVSPAAISGAVRYLQSLHIVHKFNRPGERVSRYDSVDDGWHSMVGANVPVYLKLAALIEGIAEDNPGAPASGARARNIAGFLRFLAARLPELAAEYRAQLD